MVSFQIDAPAHAIGKALGLFEYLFEHEMSIAALFYLAQLNVYRFNFRTQLPVIDIHHFQLLALANDSNVAILQIDHLIGILDDGACI